MFRRRSTGAHRRQAGQELEETSSIPGSGPWDAGESYPERARVDLGSLLIPVEPGMEVQLNVAEEHIVAASVTHGRSSLQVQALAAPKSGSLWDDVREEVATEVGQLGGQTSQTEGPFGTEVRATLPAEPGPAEPGPAEPAPAQPGPAGPGAAGPGGGTLEPARFFGVDGPRWLLRGVIRGEAAADDDLARPLEDVFADIVVVRGDHPAPPRDLLEIRLPAELQQAMEQEMAGQEMAGQEMAGQETASERSRYPSPFERGPEITETR